jgi:hypothetical protein
VRAWAIAVLLAFAAHLDVTPDATALADEAGVCAVDTPSAPTEPAKLQGGHGLVALVAQMTRISVAAQVSLVLPLRSASDVGAGSSHARRIERPPTLLLV